MKKVLLGTLAALALLPAAANAQQYGGEAGSLSTSDTSISPGDPVTVSGSGFAASSEVAITIESTPQTLTTVTADAQGEITATARIPSDVSAGTHTLKATGVTPDGATLVLSVVVSIIGSEGSGLSGTGTGVLAGTGARVGLLVVAAAAFLAGGIAAVLVARRRAGA